ncbi:hypothetical protein [Lysobacter xanthus]
MSMSASVQQVLALILFLPWFAILTGLFCFYPREPRHARRRAFDLATIALALVAFVLVVRWAHGYAVPTGSAGNIWRQVLATTSGYAVFLGVMVAGWFARRRWLRGLS